MTPTRTQPRGICTTCGHEVVLTKLGAIRKHGTRRVGPAGEYTDNDTCPGSGQLPEVTP